MPERPFLRWILPAILGLLAGFLALAWTFGWFLRIATCVNAIFYFAIFAVLACFIGLRRSRSE